ncbi:MAG: hypothetical protein QM594_19900, partial [Niabella sp.]
MVISLVLVLFLIRASAVFAGLLIGKLQLKVLLPGNWNSYDVLYVTAKDKYNKELFTWSFPISSPA